MSSDELLARNNRRSLLLFNFISKNLLPNRFCIFTDLMSVNNISLVTVLKSVNTKIKKCPKPISKPVQSKYRSPVCRYLRTDIIPKNVHKPDLSIVKFFCFSASSEMIILSLSNEISTFFSLNACIVVFIMFADGLLIFALFYPRFQN